MLQKSKLKKAINVSRKKIAFLEQKRTRSQAALVFSLNECGVKKDTVIFAYGE